MKRITFISVISLLYSFFSIDAAAGSIVEFQLPSPAVAGVYIEDIITGEVLVDVNGGRSLLPASITKAITSASVLAEHKPDYRFATEVFMDGNIANGVLDGNIVVKVCGDPTLESSHFPEYLGFADSIVVALKQSGVTEISGRVLISSEDFINQPVPSGWVEEDFAWPYGAWHFSTNYKDNKFVLTMPSRKSEPFVPGLTVKYTPSKGGLKVERKRDSNVYMLRGSVRKGRQEIALSNPNPEETLRHDLESKITGQGIVVGDKEKTVSGATRQVLYVHKSPELGEVLRSLMFRSDNMMAEGALRILAKGETREKAIDRELRLWELRNIDTEGVYLEDGSGLSRKDRMTPYFMADVLGWMASHYNASDYVSLFPKAGLDGTMKSFLKDSSLEGKIAMKTGSMRDVQCYAGYKLDEEGFPSHVVVFMINNIKGNRAKIKESIEKLLLDTFACEE